MIVNTYPRHAEAERIALATVAKPLDEHELPWESAHMGGGCMAWATECDDGLARILICDEGNTLGDAATTVWLVGIHPHEDWDEQWQDEAPTLEEALNLATLAMAARAFAIGFRADAPMTYREFVASGRDVADVGAVVGETDQEGAPGRVYANGSCYINGTEGDWCLTISNGSWNGPLPGLERRLFEYAAGEGYLKPAPAAAPATPPLWQVQFPDYPAQDMPAIPAGWTDQSWRNDTAPFFLASPSLGVFVDYADMTKRAYEDGERFGVMPMVNGMHPLERGEPLLCSDDWQAVLAFVAAYVPPSPVILPQDGELDALTAELNAYAAEQGLEPRSADEMAMERREVAYRAERRGFAKAAQKARNQAEWLDDFCERWEEEEGKISEAAQRLPAPSVPMTESEAMRAFLAAEYVKRIGYDPFADSPSISPVEVARTLLEHGDENLRAALDAVAEDVAGAIATARRNAFPA